jgi:YidC/Oxa1 family membrane protein insertase
MESQRFALFFVFAFSIFFLLDAWHKDQRPPEPPAPAIQTPAPGPSATASKPVTGAVSAPNASAVPASVAATEASSKGEIIKVETDVYLAEISTVGGDFRRLELKLHKDPVDKSRLMVLFQSSPEHTYMAQSGLVGAGLPNHRTLFTAKEKIYSLATGQDSLEVRLEAASGGVALTKIYRFRRGTYAIDVTQEITNQGSAPIQPFEYLQLVRDNVPPPGDSAMLPTFTGVAMYTEKEKFQKIPFGDIDKNKSTNPKSADDGWIAILQHYFFSAWLPAPNTTREYFVRKLDGNLYAAGVIIPRPAIAPGATEATTVPLYAGPQEQDRLSKLAPGLDLTVDYGWLTVIAVPLFWVLSWVHEWVGNWGIAIILLTVVIKLIFYPLSQASYRSMAKMRVVAPKMQKIKEQYGDDRQRMQQAMMDLYKREKINPLGGCLPIAVQIPVFISLYWVLLASVELRQAPFFGWIGDLSAPDPWYILPVLMGISMIIQTRLNPEPPDPVQAKVMKIMPVAFSVFFFFFPAGLVLYWLVNNVLSILQQWHINRAMESGDAAPVKK